GVAPVAQPGGYLERVGLASVVEAGRQLGTVQAVDPDLDGDRLAGSRPGSEPTDLEHSPIGQDQGALRYALPCARWTYPEHHVVRFDLLEVGALVQAARHDDLLAAAHRGLHQVVAQAGALVLG